MKKSDCLTREKENIKHMPRLIGTEARLKLLREEAKLRIMVAFQNDCIIVGKNVVRIEKYISQEQDGKFVYDLDVACS